MSTSQELPAAGDLLTAFWDISLTGVIVLQPLCAPDSEEIVDFSHARLNPAAQRTLQLPEYPAVTLLQHNPRAAETGVLNFYRDTFFSGEAGRFFVEYERDGLDHYYHLAARRSGNHLVVSIIDTAEQSRVAAVPALRESRAREHAARAEADHYRTQLQRLLQQAPVAIVLFEGPEHRITVANQRTCTIWDRSAADVLGLPLLMALPELRGQGFEELLNRVFETHEPYEGVEVPIMLWNHGQLVTTYHNFNYQPLYDTLGGVVGVVGVGVEVTDQVRARRSPEEREPQPAGEGPAAPEQ